MNRSKSRIEFGEQGHAKPCWQRRLVLAGAMIAVCAGGGFAQTSILTTAPPADDTGTRPRRFATEDLSTQKTTAPTIARSVVRTERRIFVRSHSLLVRAAVVEDKLLKQPTFSQLGFVLTRDQSDADLILELRHDLFTMYVFIVYDAKTSTVIMGGKLSSLGGTVANKVAKRFVKEMPRPAGP